MARAAKRYYSPIIGCDKMTLYSPINILLRNRYTREGLKARKKTVNLEYYHDDVNLGDILAETVTKKMLERKGLDLSAPVLRPYTHLMTIGSVLGGRGLFDATVWGSGFRSFSETAFLGVRRRFQTLDVRAVRGPITRRILLQAGRCDCPEIYGDPAVLMPLFYAPDAPEKSGKIGLVSHFLSPLEIPVEYRERIKELEIRTNDDRAFIDALRACDRVISASLHGIILAETYGIPAVFLNVSRDGELLKYYDWYFSTERQAFPMAYSVEEAVRIDPPAVPDLSDMQDRLIQTFPYDLWL